MVRVHSIDSVISDPAIRNGQPILAGTQIRIIDLVASHLYRGHSPDELAVNYNLDLGQVYAALAYYYQHKQEIDGLIREAGERAEQYRNELEQDGRVIRVE